MLCFWKFYNEKTCHVISLEWTSLLWVWPKKIKKNQTWVTFGNEDYNQSNNKDDDKFDRGVRFTWIDIMMAYCWKGVDFSGKQKRTQTNMRTKARLVGFGHALKDQSQNRRTKSKQNIEREFTTLYPKIEKGKKIHLFGNYSSIGIGFSTLWSESSESVSI